MKKILLLAVLLAAAVPACAFEYFYFSDSELTAAGDTIRFWGFNEASQGIFRTNDCFYCIENSPFSGTAIMACHSSYCGYHHSNATLIHDAPELPFPENADALREWFNGPFGWGQHFQPADEHARAVIRLQGDYMDIWWGIQGTPLDTTYFPWPDISIPISPTGVYFFECPVRIAGVLGPGIPRVIIASSNDIGLDDDVYIAELNLDHFEIPEYAASSLALVAEGNIVIENTWANGRNNQAQGSDIIISAFLVALGESFTFAQQNDAGDPYVYSGTPDERGQIHLIGALAQKRHGYVHRSNLGGTGYLRDYKYDDRLVNWNIGLFPHEQGAGIPDSLDFGDAEIGTIARDTVMITSSIPMTYSGAQTSYPFGSTVNYTQNDTIKIPLSFAPPQTLPYYGYVNFYLNGGFRSISLTGRGVEPDTSLGLRLSLSPNPFNATTTFEFTLPRAGDVELIVYDVLGREAKRMNLASQTAGRNRIFFDANSLPSGVYFARLSAAGQVATRKLLLVK